MTRAAPVRTAARVAHAAAAPTPALRQSKEKASRQAHTDSRAPLVLDAAARLFCRQGFEGTSVREIAGAAGMLPGSLYCHFATKEDLLVAVYLRGCEQICSAAQAAVLPLADPWERLEAACVAHLEAILRDDDYARVVVRVRPADVPGAAARLVAQRDRYEALWAALVAALPLPRRTDRRALRLMLLGALNWAQNWYRADGTSSPRALARQFTALLRQNQEITAP
ncbi:MAG: TetR family transcriptional regulator [Rubrivivax sp.]|nr:TetR family transcriptional regulator [Rubrivivax sp.]